jgi:hypothetical protein
MANQTGGDFCGGVPKGYFGDGGFVVKNSDVTVKVGGQGSCTLTPEQQRNLDIVNQRGAGGSSHLADRAYLAGMQTFRPNRR